MEVDTSQVAETCHELAFLDPLLLLLLSFVGRV